MPQAHNIKAAELHEMSAKSHRMAADLHGKKMESGGNEHAAKALSQSEEAHKASASTGTKSAAAPVRP